MKNTTRKYIEYLYLNSKTASMEIEHADPLKVDISQGIIGFRFFEKQFEENEEKYPRYNIINLTNWFLLGTRYTINDILGLYDYSRDTKWLKLADRMSESDIESVCITANGENNIITPMADGDITLDEYDEYIDRIFKESKKTLKVKVVPHKR